jgi:hypothetical protein
MRNLGSDQIGFCLSCHFDMSVAIEKSWKLTTLLEVTEKISHPKGFEMTYKLLKYKNTGHSRNLWKKIHPSLIFYLFQLYKHKLELQPQLGKTHLE